jgi:hypothetical protein
MQFCLGMSFYCVGGLVGAREGSEGKGITPSFVSEWHSTCDVTISLPAWVGFLCRERSKGSVEVLHQYQGSRRGKSLIDPVLLQEET